MYLSVIVADLYKKEKEKYNTQSHSEYNDLYS